jgi:hypothetical protein
MNQGNDYGVGSGTGNILTQQPANQSLILLTAYGKDELLGNSQASSKARALHLPIEEDSGDEDQSPVELQTETSIRTTKRRPQGSRQETSEPLFLSSEDEEVGAAKYGEGDDRDDEGTETLRSVGSSIKSGAQRGQTRRVLVVVDDHDSDDGTTFKGFGAKIKPNRG